MQFDEGFWRATALMVAGTFLFFWSLAGFALAAIERTRHLLQGPCHVHDARSPAR
ncbi:MAG: hypothetical protein ACLSVD_12815 [Eggerthellaceae bacterium]